MSCLRVMHNEATRVVTWTLVMGHLPRYPLSVLKDRLCCDENLTLSFGENANKYFHDYFRENWKLRKRMLFHVQIEHKIRMFDELKRLLCRANAHLGENSSNVILALQEFSVTFKYGAGRNDVAADCLSRLK